MLSIFVAENQDDWDKHLSYVMMAYQSSQHDVTEFTPNILILGLDEGLPLDVVIGSPEDRTETTGGLDYVEGLRKGAASTGPRVCPATPEDGTELPQAAVRPPSPGSRVRVGPGCLKEVDQEVID